MHAPGITVIRHAQHNTNRNLRYFGRKKTKGHNMIANVE